MGYKLTKQSKLKRNSDFQLVYRKGVSFANRFMVMYILPQRLRISRVGYAAGKRLGNAVIRNRAKRLMREVFRINQNRINTDLDIILIARQPLIGVDFLQVNKAFLNLCGKAEIFK